ncbi:nucleotidyltransferase domain-containing protein [Adhaeribacter pallidiroseus]|uniref:Nucleotidyltransferase domain-containing protein n=1 Tax=Adhaeribacter pallidiroseus TaxID=2072847 RepID=A0A369QB11_9BACT|nr:nucleotidyltransferase domain-containing protein [Adhaeribacter pallidiroseus]RDC61894.1 uncharacterized protein AHMF7616_00483 [Adhaeribacter pallidiroseus]
MRKRIQEKLRAVEKEYGVSILLACETGSRAWGFSSPDSDYDVRFIYRHPASNYLALNEPQDHIEYLKEDLDLVGWDVRKSLKLLLKSNAAMFERLQSPIIYQQQGNFRKQLQALAPAYFSGQAGLHHYASMAFNYYKTCVPAEAVKLKSYFYLLRTTLASLWIVEKCRIPPMWFQELLPLVQDARIKNKIDELLLLKAEMNETYLHPKEAALEQYCWQILNYCEPFKNAFTSPLGAVQKLNNLFRTIITEPWP